MSKNMTCSSCQKPKHQLQAVKSKLLVNSTLYLCTDCLKAGLEPRHFIILAAQASGPEYVAAYVKDHRYIGHPITLKELIKS